MQAFCCEVERALTKFGMAMAASIPGTATAGSNTRAAALWLPLPMVRQPSGVFMPTE